MSTVSCATDLNECALERHDCDSNAWCIDRKGSYDCECKDGFIGNGIHCAGKTEWEETDRNKATQRKKIIFNIKKETKWDRLMLAIILNYTLKTWNISRQTVKWSWCQRTGVKKNSIVSDRHALIVLQFRSHVCRTKLLFHRCRWVWGESLRSKHRVPQYSRIVHVFL